MPELVGFQTMIILDPNGMNFDAGGVFGPDFWLLFKSGSSYCVEGFEEVQFQKNYGQKKVDTRMHIARNTGTLILISHR